MFVLFVRILLRVVLLSIEMCFDGLIVLFWILVGTTKLGSLCRLIIQLRILKYFANCNLDPLFVCSNHGNNYLFVPAISYGDGFCSGHFYGNGYLFVPSISYGNSYCSSHFYGNGFCSGHFIWWRFLFVCSYYLDNRRI